MATTADPRPKSILFQLAWKTFSFSYGTFTLGTYVLLAYLRKSNFISLSPHGMKELSTARNNLWDLSKQPYGLTHRFCVLRNGVKLHYVESLPSAKPSSKTSLIIFIHGFPDSWLLWQHYLKSGKLKEQAVMIALDLPGYGGSDSLNNYGPDEVLEAVAEFILQMREQYILVEEGKARSSSRVVLVAHDWGATVGFRLAAEAPQLADRFILSNAVHPPLSASNVNGRLSSVYRMLHTFVRKPREWRILHRAASNLYPLFRQLGRSGYIFIFTLPLPLAGLLGRLGNFWFLRYLNAVAIGSPDPTAPLAGMRGAEALASSVGPSVRECSSTPNGSPELIYSDSVRQRASSGGWAEKIKVYRHGLAMAPWEKSLQVLWDLNQIEQNTGRRSSSTQDLFDVGPAGSLRSPTTVIWGAADLAIENSIAIEGMGDFFAARPSQLVLISKCGHWAPLDKQAIPVFEEAIEWAVQGEKGSLKDRLGENFPMAKFITER